MFSDCSSTSPNIPSDIQDSSSRQRESCAGSPTEAYILRNKSDKDWIQLSIEDPYFAVLTDEKFRRENLNDDLLKEFFESGEKYINLILDTVRSYLDPGFQPRKALDFGC